jgi:hypothetical protein
MMKQLGLLDQKPSGAGDTRQEEGVTPKMNRENESAGMKQKDEL